ncbi:MAG TPA: dihydropteroate synthase [Verrucomicrobiae bacterium]|nr:dihydropteroate synthase [Verrucomicrobiae bacterium]
MIFRARQHEFRFPRPAVVMGVLNVTPDSFYDGGKHFNPADPSAAIDHAHELVAQGAGIIDIGGESTRPGAAFVSVKEELARVIPVIEALRGKTKASVSIDTQKSEVAREAIAAGADIINNIAAAANDPAMWQIAAATGAGYIAMHMQGEPQTMQKNPQYKNVVREIRDFFARQFEQLTAAGVSREQIVFDVGIGFGKTLEHNLQLLAHLDEARAAERPMLLGVSRKSFMGRLLKLEADQRLAPALACSVWAASRGIEIFRTHDVAETVAALRMFEAIHNERERNNPD